MNLVILYQYGTAFVLAGTWLLITVAAVRRRGRRGVWFMATAPLFVAAWYALEFVALVYGCIRVSGAGC